MFTRRTRANERIRVHLRILGVIGITILLASGAFQPLPAALQEGDVETAHGTDLSKDTLLRNRPAADPESPQRSTMAASCPVSTKPRSR